MSLAVNPLAKKILQKYHHTVNTSLVNLTTMLGRLATEEGMAVAGGKQSVVTAHSPGLVNKTLAKITTGLGCAEVHIGNLGGMCELTTAIHAHCDFMAVNALKVLLDDELKQIKFEIPSILQAATLMIMLRGASDKENTFR